MKSIKLIILMLLFSISLFGASYSCDGEDVLNINGATSNASQSYSEDTSSLTENGRKRYFKFKTAVDGEITVDFSSDYDHRMEIGTSCDSGDIYYPSDTTKKSDSKTFTVNAGEWYYVNIKENNRYNKLKFTVNFNFISNSSGSCGGCDCSLDTDSNDVSPGNLIPDLDHVDGNVTTCLSGESEDDDKDYYHFTTGTKGIFHIVTSSPNGHEYHMEIESDKQGTLLEYDTDENRDLTYSLAENETITILFKETGSDLDQYQADITFTEDEYDVENADDICYDDLSYTGTMCIDIGLVKGGYECKQNIPLKNRNPDSDLTNVIVTLDTSDLNMDMYGDCGIDNGEGDESCSETSAIDFGPFGVFSSGITYDLGSLAVDTNDTIWEYAEGSIAFFNRENLYATYERDGKKYRGKIKQCTDSYCPNLSRGDRDFTIRNPEDTRNIYGNYTVIGNQNLCTDKNNNGTCEDDPKTTSNSYPSLYVDIDGDATTVNSSSSTLNIPEGSKVVWAGLYWQGTIHNSDNDDDPSDEDFGRDNLWVDGNKILNATNYDSSHKEIDLKEVNNGYGAYEACKIKFKTPNGTYIEISADQLDYSQLGYGGFADVTNLLNKDNPNGVYTVADIKSQTGRETSHGNYAAWSLVVIYENDEEKFRNISLFDGFVTVDSGYDGELVMDGFLTQKNPPIESKLAFFTLDGDGGTNSISIDDQKVSNEDHPEDSFFNSTINDSIQRNPAYPSARLDLDYIDLVDILSPSQTSAVIKPRSGGDRYTASYFILSAELRTFDFCYDYTYGQDGYYQTAPSIKPARIEGIFNENPINVKLYFKNQENSDITVSNLTVNIDPIDSNTTYKSDSTYVTKPKSSSQEFVPDEGRDTGPNKDNNISIGEVNSLDYFYTYYSVEHTNDELNASVNVFLNFDMSIDINGSTLYFENQKLNLSNMEPCSGGAIYEPVRGRFNVVHPSMEDEDLSSKYYYNLPTQVVKRKENFKVLSLDPDNLDTAQTVSTVVGLEMLRVDGFHYTTATCTDTNTSVISDRVWVVLDNSITGDAEEDTLYSAKFFDNAVRNAAFRIVMNFADNNDSLYGITKSGDTYGISNLTTDATSCGCLEYGMSKTQLDSCMECLYGIKTKVLCSRDNFAIRPVAFHMSLKDINGSVTIPEGSTSQTVAAGYDYQLDINATTYIGSSASVGYIRSISDDSNFSSGTAIGYQWNPTSATLVCNAPTDKMISINFSNGHATKTTKIDNVGEYNLALRDREWTVVDYLYILHHTSPYFKASFDCQLGSTTVPASNSGILVGCDISSEYHENGQDYYDYKLNAVPYKFDLTTLASSIRPDNASANNGWLYDASIDNLVSGDYPDINMSYHIYGQITAKGKDNTQLTNFTQNCYAKDVSFTLPRSTYSDTTMTFRQSIETLDENGSRIAINFEDGNNSDYTLNIQSDKFVKARNGSASINTRYNFEKEVDKAKNPQKITFNTLSIDCAIASECSAYADGSTSHTPISNKDINDTVTFLYAKVHAPRTITKTDDVDVPIYYETYCYGVGCDKTLLPNGTTSINSDDPRWWINTNHNSSAGTAGTITQKGGTYVTVQTGKAPTGNHPDKVGLHYDASKGYPYKATMKMVPDNWLIYNKYNPNATSNDFEVEFYGPGGDWAGKYESNTATDANASNRTSRRLIW
ncbi:MAG: hypothetical protein GXO11_01520 [Epsilonproteobacteria bacterium]|nr:hypothetical protein [Campylobacterota bacterium]